MTTLELIPYEVYIEYFIDNFTIKELGALSMASKTLKKIFDSNEIWKKQHFQTTPIKIVDSSVYIGSYEQRKIRISSSISKSKFDKLFSEMETKILKLESPPLKPSCVIELIDRFAFNKTITLLEDYNYLFRTKYFDEPPPGYDFCELPFEYINMNDSIFTKDLHCCKKIPNDLYSLNIPGTVWSGWPLDGRPAHLYICNQPKAVQEAYIDYLKSEGIMRSTIHEHYITETLDYEGVRKNYKSYKKMTLKKFFTKEKKKLNPQKKKVITVDQKIETIEYQINMLIKQKKKLIREKKDLCLDRDKQVSLCANLELYIKSI